MADLTGYGFPFPAELLKTVNGVVTTPDNEFLGSLSSDSFVTSSGVLNIPARDILVIQARVISYGIAGVVGFRFNGDAGNNYYTRYITFAPSGTTATNVEETSANLLRVAGDDTTLGRAVQITINNKLNKEKICQVSVLTGTGDATVAPTIEFGGGGWVNTTAQITSIEMIEDDGHFL